MASREREKNKERPQGGAKAAERETGVNLNKFDDAEGGEVRGRRLAPSSSFTFTLA